MALLYELPQHVSSDSIEQAIYTTLASRNEPITASELKWRCPETRDLSSKFITRVCKRMVRAGMIKRKSPVGTQYVPRFFVKIVVSQGSGNGSLFCFP